MIPRATYRLQFHKGFTFGDATRHAGYFAELGISHIYASPILTARAGSPHGYDVVDHAHINPELGGEPGLRTLSRELRQKGLGLIVDIVPNHVAVGGADNAWWLDLLANGRESRYADVFDIDWDAPGLEGKVLAPFLGEEPRSALEKGTLKLVRENGRLAFAYYQHRFPLRAQDQGLSEQQSITEMENLLDRQHFVLTYWREADRRINWRRFFDITDLAAIRAGDPEVFEAVHAKILALYAEGIIDGVRVDHVDGLADPAAYCRTLRGRLEALRSGAIIYVEKILATGERLPADWQVDGTTGYDFLELSSAVLHGDGGGALTDLWHTISGRQRNFEQEELLARREILANKFVSELAATARAFSPLLDEPLAETKELLAEMLVRLRCYRSYATGKPGSPGPGPFLTTAIKGARTENPEKTTALHRLEALFHRDDGDCRVADALRRFAQLSAPLAAKSVEDTAFYRYGRLLSRNDVGTDPRRHFLPAAQFHQMMQQKARDWPDAMLTTATHDHKRGEDARARLSVLSRHAGLWRDFVTAAAPPADLAPGDTYQLHQTLFGAWPDRVDEDLARRVEGWCVKFLREEKLRSSWSDPDTGYESRFCGYARALILGPEGADYRRRLEDLLSRLESELRAAMIFQLILRNTAPGVPDLYQGREFEDLSLVDPDNRRPVDFAGRQAALRDQSNEKQRLLKQLLTARQRDPELWRHGDYLPLEAKGYLAFVRHYHGRSLSVWLRRDRGEFGADILLASPCVEILTERCFDAGALHQDVLFASCPAAVFYSANDSGSRGIR
jgi:(1->4)-alpha-D-glucan 1-alpha-D-glucosylmutase